MQFVPTQNYFLLFFYAPLEAILSRVMLSLYTTFHVFILFSSSFIFKKITDLKLFIRMCEVPHTSSCCSSDVRCDVHFPLTF